MKYIITITIIIISLLLILDVKEDYYTYFIPFLSTKKKNNFISYKNFFKENVKIGYTIEYSKIKLNKILILSIKNDKFFNFTLLKYKIDNNVYENLISNKLNLGIISNIYLFTNINKISKSLKFICNVSTPTIYFIYNKRNVSVNSIYDSNITFRTLDNYKNIINMLIDNPVIETENTIKDLEDYVLNNGTDIILFVDDNPSKILDNIIKKDYNNKIEVIPIDFYNIRKNLGSYLFKSTFIRNKNIDSNKNRFFNYNKIETLYYFESLYTINNYNYIYNLVKNIFNNKNLLDDEINVTNFSLSPSFIIPDTQVSKYYNEINLTSNIDNYKCNYIIGKKECNEKNINRLSYI